MFDKILGFIFSGRRRKQLDTFTKSMQSEFVEEFLKALLSLMKTMFFLNKNFRRNINNFKGRYLFKSRDNKITVAAVFDKNKMNVFEKNIDDANVTVTFKDQKALMDFLLSPNPDILNSVLKQEVTFDGNLNYLYKFAYMARRLQIISQNPQLLFS